MNKVRPIYLYICLTLIIMAGVGLFAFKPFSAKAAETYFAGGDGSQDNPYQIETAEQLKLLAELVGGDDTKSEYTYKCYKLTKDIDLSSVCGEEIGSWAPIGEYHIDGNRYIDEFQGFFDGDGHSVTGLYINVSDQFQGLFGRSGGVIQNLSVYGYVKAGNGRNAWSAGIAGVSYGTVTNCNNYCTVEVELGKNSPYLGGVVGQNAGTLSNCNNFGTVTGYGYVGGVVGYNTGTVNNCHNSGEISGKGNNVGGVVGNGTATNCYNTGTVNGGSDVGGVSGIGSPANCYNTGSVNGSSYVGGVSGSGSPKNCYNTGTVSGNSNVGAVTGSGTATNCYYPEDLGVEDTKGGVKATSDEFASGKITWLLQGSQSTFYWGQTLGSDDFPLLVTFDTSAERVWRIAFYDENDAEITEKTKYVNDGDSGIAEPDDMTKDGFTAEWYSDSSRTNKYVFGSTINADTNIYLKWVKSSYTVTFDYQDGRNSTSEEYDPDTAYGSTLPNPTRTGYTFGGWFKDSGCTGNAVKSTDTVSDNHKLYAKWTIITYSITYELDGGTNNSSNPAAYTVEDTPITLSDPAREGYDFAGWTGEGITTPTKPVVIAKDSIGDREYIANWTAQKYDIIYKDEGGAAFSGSTNSPTKHTYGTETALAEATKTGYTFIGWYTDPDCTNEVTSLGAEVYTADITLYAKWEIINYNIEYVLNGGTSNGGNPDTYTVESTFTLNAPIRDGYTFDSWYEDSTYTTKVTEITKGTTGDKTFYAKWVVETYGITYDTDGGIIENESNYREYEYGIGLTLPTPTKTGYHFDGWYEDDNFSGVPVTTISATDTGAKTFYAKWTANKYNVTLDYQDGRTETLVVEYDSTYIGLPEAATAPTREGYSFDGWYDEMGTKVTASTQVKTAENHTLYARWNAETYTVTFIYNGATGGDTDPNKSVTFGETYGVLPTPTKTGYSFGGWYTEDNGSGRKIEADTTVTTVGAHTLYAYWTKCDHSSGNWIANSYEYDDTITTEKHNHICGDCLEKVEENHRYSGWVDDGDNEHHTRTCVCGRTDRQEHNLNKVGFTLGNCITPDRTDYICLSCNAAVTKYGNTQPDIHDWRGNGYDELGHHLICSLCRKTDVSDHIWDEGTVVSDPTCKREGQAILQCTVDGCAETKTIELEINPEAHNWSSEWEYDDIGSTHWHICLNGCGVTKPTGHTWGNGVPTLEATCTTAGEETVTCTDCGYSRTETTNPKGHDFSDEWKSDVNGHWHECSRDSVRGEIIPHTEKEVITTPATPTTDGLKTYICDDCGYEIRTEVIPAKGEPGNITVDSESGANAPAVSIDAGTTSRLEAEVYAEHTTPEEREAIDNGSDLDIILRVEDAGDTVPVSDKQATEAVIAGANYTLGQYLNIDMLKFIDGQEVDKITKLSSPISVTIEVPENMRNANRAFVIVRIHEGNADTLRDIDNDPNTITIMTDRFSTYAIAYRDGQQDGRPGGQNSGTVTPGNTVYPGSVPTDNSSSDSNDKSGDSNSNTDDVSSAAGLYGANELLADRDTATVAEMFIPVGIVLVSMMFIIRKRSKANK